MGDNILKRARNIISANKLEFAITVFFVMLIIIVEYFLPQKMYMIENILIKYFTQERLNMIIAYSSMIIGIYMGIIALVSTLILSVTKNILMNNIDKILYIKIRLGLFINISILTIIIFLPIDSLKFPFILIIMLLCIISVISLWGISACLINIFRDNMENMVKIIEKNEENERKFFEQLRVIDDSINKTKQENNNKTK